MSVPSWEWVIFGTWWTLLFTMALGGISAAPWVPTRGRERKSVVDAVPVPAGATVYDLGAGDGSMLFAMAERYPKARYVGYEIGVPPWFVGVLRKWAGGEKYKNVFLRYGDLFGKDISDADVVFVFLLEKAYKKLHKKLAAELKDDATVVIEAWGVPGVPCERVVRAEKALPMYVYKGSSFRQAVA